MGKFPLGQVVITPAALKAINPEVVLVCLNRHHQGDWGEVCDDDKAENELSLREGFRLLSAYSLPRTEAKIWIITEADRSLTTILLPEEY